MTGTVRIEAGGRWEAVDLLHSLARRHSYLVQLDHSRFALYLEEEWAEDELPSELRKLVERWLAAHALPSTTIRLPDGRRQLIKRSAGRGSRPVAT